MLADPQSVTYNSGSVSLPAIARGANTSKYQKDDGTMALTISHALGKRNRSTVRLDFSKIAADPLISAQNIKYSMSAYLVIDRPVTGFTVAEAKLVVDALTAYLTASSGAKVTSVLGFES
jgi:hypothetical protein